jgi:hypothetical protein
MFVQSHKVVLDSPHFGFRLLKCRIPGHRCGFKGIATQLAPLSSSRIVRSKVKASFQIALINLRQWSDNVCLGRACLGSGTSSPV